MISIEVEVARFQEWAPCRPGLCVEWETEYESWPALRQAAAAALADSRIGDAEIELLVYALARDNECELIKEMLAEHAGNGIRVARAAMASHDLDARWQVADFLGQVDTEEARALLRRLVADADEYVRRRALLAISRADPECAEQTAWRWLSSEHEYSRLAALAVLHDLRSRNLPLALDRLRDDPSEHVRDAVARSENAS